MLTIEQEKDGHLLAWRAYEQSLSDECVLIFPRKYGGLVICYDRETWTIEAAHSEDTLNICRNAVSVEELLRYIGDSDKTKDRYESVV